MKELYRFLFLGWALILLTTVIIAIPMFMLLFFEGYIANIFRKKAHAQCDSDEDQHNGNGAATDIAGCQTGPNQLH